MKRKLGTVIGLLSCITVLYASNLSVFCMPSIDVYSQYEQNIVQYCDTNEEFIALTDDGSTLLPAMGTSDNANFSYYTVDKYVKQLCITNDKVCIVTWLDNEVVDVITYNKRG